MESNFNDLKNRVFSGKQLPLRIDDFLRLHLQSLAGTMNLAAAAAASAQRMSQPSTIDQHEISKPEQHQVLDHSLDSREKSATVTEETSVTVHQENTTADNVINSPCTACLNGDYPSGAHKCISCGVSVHIILNCSFPLPDLEDVEGYDESRICYGCSLKGNKRSEELAKENWRGKSFPLKKRSYLTPQPDFLKTDFSAQSI